MLIDDQGVHYELDKKSLTANIAISREAEGDIIIPFSVLHECNEYIITDISDSAFKHSKIKSLTITENSSITSLPNFLFEKSTIQKLHLSSNIKKMGEYWCYYTPDLTNITISSNNEHFQIHDHNILLGRETEEDENFNIIYFASRSIEKIFIPSAIKRINSCCFQNCKKLKNIKIEKNSELEIIDKYAFSNSSIEKIQIPKNVFIIDEYAFHLCTNIQNITIERNSSLRFLGKSSFESSSIKDIKIPNQVETLEENTFSYCSKLTKIEFFDNSELRTIKSEAFCESNINELYLPRNVQQLEDQWCSSTYKLKTIKISPKNKYLKMIDNKILVGKSNLEVDNFDILYFAIRSIDKVFIPSTIKRINSCCFQNCKSLTNIEIQENSELEIIDTSAFSRSSIETIQIPKHVSIVGNYAFFWCNNLKSIEFEADSELYSIGISAFEGSQISSISTEIASQSTSNSRYSSKKFLFPKKLAIIHNSAFYSCQNIQSVDFEYGSELHFIGKSAFELSSITSISIPNMVKSIEEKTFSSCKKLTKIDLSEESELITIKSEALADLNLEELYLPSNVQKLENKWCSGTSKLKTIIISPKNKYLKLIDNKILVGKSNLTNDNFDIIYYANRDIEKIFIPSAIKRINSCCFQNCKKLKNIEFEKNSELEIIDKYAFSNSSIEKIQIPKNVFIIDEYAFHLCTNIQNITIERNSSLRFLGKSSFESSSIKDIKIPNQVETLEENTFSYCSKLTKIEFYDNSELRTIKSRALSNTPKLSSIKLNNQHFNTIDDKILIGKSNLEDCNYDSIYFAGRDIEEIMIPSTINHIEPFALSNKTLIKTIEVKKDSKLAISPIWLDFPQKYKLIIDEICDSIIQNVYSKFSFKFYDFDEVTKSENNQDCIENVEFNLFFYLINSKFITFYFTNKEYFDMKSNSNLLQKIDCYFCIENECIIIENADLVMIDILLQKLYKYQISIINLSEKHEISIKPNYDAIEEVQNFCEYFMTIINKNYFIKNTITSIIGFLIRRYNYPSNYFRDKSFFDFDQQNKLNDQPIKTEIKNFLLDENVYLKFDAVFNEIKSFEERNIELSVNSNYRTFCEDDFIILREIYTKDKYGIYYLIMHKKSLYVFMMKKFDENYLKTKEIMREIEFCKYSHRCFTPFYGFLTNKSSKNIGLIYEYMANGSLDSFIITNKIDENIYDMYSLIVVNRIFEGIEFIHKQNLIYRDLKPSNILVDHNYMPYLSDFETVRSINSSESFTINLGSPLYTSPEQDKTGIVSFPSDIYSFGLTIYYIYEKHDMWEYYPNKNKKIKPMTKGPDPIKKLYENCVKYLPKERIKISEIRKIINDCLNYFSIEEYFQNEDSSINKMQIYDFLFEKLINQPNRDYPTVYQNKIRGIHQLFLYNAMKNKSSLLLNKLKYENDFDFLQSYHLPYSEISWNLFNLGRMHINKYGVKKDYFKAKEYFEQSAKFNHPYAFFYLGKIYENGLGVKKDYLKAKDYYEQSVNLGYILAFYNLGYLYYNGYGVKQDYKKAKEYFKKSHDSYGLLYLGYIYEFGKGVKQNYSKAIEYFKKSSAYNNSIALNKLGIIYNVGYGVEQDFLKAIEYYQKSSDLNNPDAIFNLASLYFHGEGVNKDYLKAKEYYEKLLAFNDPDAINILGNLYENALGVEQDLAKAIQFYIKASELNNSDALYNLGVLFYYGRGVKQDYLKAKELFEKSSKLNNSNAFNFLGNLYFYGYGVKQDYLKAKEFYEISSKYNNSAAFLNLGNLYYYGYGVKQDYFKAKDYYEISSKYNNSTAFFLSC